MPHKDREKRRERDREYYLKNRERLLEERRHRYYVNVEEEREKRRKWKRQNRERHNEINRKYREKNRVEISEKARESYYNNIEKAMVRGAKSRSRDKGLPFDLTIEDLEVPEKCPILGLELKVGGDSSRDISPSLDRIVPELGYVKGNIRVISLRANRLKSDASIEELEAILKYMKEHERDSI